VGKPAAFSGHDVHAGVFNNAAAIVGVSVAVQKQLARAVQNRRLHGAKNRGKCAELYGNYYADMGIYRPLPADNYACAGADRHSRRLILIA
jgi:hypothetical protein